MIEEGYQDEDEDHEHMNILPSLKSAPSIVVYQSEYYDLITSPESLTSGASIRPWRTKPRY